MSLSLIETEIAVPAHLCAELHQQVRKLRPLASLEIGLGFGASTMAICQGIAENKCGHHIAIDPFQSLHYKNIGLQRLADKGLAKHCTLIEKLSYIALPELLAQGRQFDFAFIDGNHYFDYVLIDFMYIDCLLSTGGIVIFDDVSLAPVRKAVSFILRNRNYELLLADRAFSPFKKLASYLGKLTYSFEYNWSLFAMTGRMGILRKRDNETRPWGYYKSF